MEILLLIIIVILILRTSLILMVKIRSMNKETTEILSKVKPRHRIVISMTTSPRRINKIHKVIENLERQTIKPDLYFINLPRVFKRDGSTFTKIPAFLINDKIKLNFCEDLGPATKIVPTCKSPHIKESDIIFSVDDDIYYPSNLIEMYLKYHMLYPNCVITGTSIFPLKGNKFDILEECELLEGFSCVLYKKRFLEDIPLEMFDKSTTPIYHYLSDDLVLSNYLVMKGIRILCFTEKNPTIKRITPFDYGLSEDALHKGASGAASLCGPGEHCNFVNYVQTIKYLKERDAYYLDTPETYVSKL
jgi:hypothetical protein